MPELPEVETVRRGLNTLIVGKKIVSITHDWPKGFPNNPTQIEQFVIGAAVTAVKRRAKVLLIELSSGYTLVTHLKMTGQLVFRGKNHRFGAGHPSASLIGGLPDKSTRVTIVFNDNDKLFFNDQRKFGWMKLMPTEAVQQTEFFQKVGPEPLEDDFTPSDFITRLRRRSKTTIKAALLDQTVIAGVGNIYADESLFDAKIHPLMMVQDLTNQQLSSLYKTLRAVLNLSISKGGSTDQHYVDAEGKRGKYLTFAKVFRREGQPCPVCGTAIIKTRVAGRGTHICPICQVAPNKKVNP